MEQARLTLIARELEGEEGWEICSPGVGLVFDLPEVGAHLIPRHACGELEVLGERHRLQLPSEVTGHVMSILCGTKRMQPVAYGEALLILRPHLDADDTFAPASLQQDGSQGLVFRSPQAGRFYRSPDPDSPPFVEAGAEVEEGRTIGLLEVMKTFSPVKYHGGEGLPAKAVVKKVLVEDRADIEEGTPLLELES